MSFAYLDGNFVGPESEDLIAFLSGCPKLSHQIRTMRMFHLSCLCLGHVVFFVSQVMFGSSSEAGDEPHLSDFFGPVESYFLSSCSEFDMFTDAASVIDCLEFLKSVIGTVVESGKSPWVYVDCFDEDTILKVLVSNYDKSRAGAAADEDGLSISANDAVFIQSSVTVQSPRIEVSKVRSLESVASASLVKNLKANGNRWGAAGGGSLLRKTESLFLLICICNCSLFSCFMLIKV